MTKKPLGKGADMVLEGIGSRIQKTDLNTYFIFARLSWYW